MYILKKKNVCNTHVAILYILIAIVYTFKKKKKNSHSLEKIHLDFTIKVQFCIMYPKLFILERFFFFFFKFGD